MLGLTKCAKCWKIIKKGWSCKWQDLRYPKIKLYYCCEECLNEHADKANEWRNKKIKKYCIKCNRKKDILSRLFKFETCQRCRDEYRFQMMDKLFDENS